MSLSDITIYDDGVFGFPGSKRYKVNTGTAGSIKAGELVLKLVTGNQATAGAVGKGSYVTVWTAGNSAKPSVGTDFIAGLAASTSTETATAKGEVDIFPNLPGMTYLGKPDVAATWDTQAEYDLLVGANVLLAVSSAGVQTILATHKANAFTGTSLVASGNGIVVEPLDVIKYPGRVRFSIKQSVNYNAL